MFLGKIKTKRQFINFVNNFEEPELIIGDSGGAYDLISCYFLVKDKKSNNSIELPGCKLTRKNYLENRINKYLEREKKLQDKYERWMYDVFGEYYRIIKN